MQKRCLIFLKRNFIGEFFVYENRQYDLKDEILLEINSRIKLAGYQELKEYPKENKIISFSGPDSCLNYKYNKMADSFLIFPVNE